MVTGDGRIPFTSSYLLNSPDQEERIRLSFFTLSPIFFSVPFIPAAGSRPSIDRPVALTLASLFFVRSSLSYAFHHDSFEITF